mgnify:CR=1 FL=1
MNFQPEVIAIPVIFLITGWMLKMWLSHQEKMKGMSLPKPERVLIDARLDRLEQAVEAIAIEIERVSEGQRYVTKLMSERALPTLLDAAPLRARIDTPH